jgi:hypothetical protein
VWVVEESVWLFGSRPPVKRIVSIQSTPVNVWNFLSDRLLWPRTKLDCSCISGSNSLNRCSPDLKSQFNPLTTSQTTLPKQHAQVNQLPLPAQSNMPPPLSLHNNNKSTYLSINMNHGRKQKRQSLSRTGGRNPHHVLSFECHWPSLGLDGGWFVKAAFDD